MKKISFFLLFLISLTFVFNSRSVRADYDVARMSLINRGFTQEYLNLLDQKELSQIANDPYVYYLGKETNLVEIDESMVSGKSISPYAVIPTSKLRLSVYAIASYNSSDNNLRYLKYTTEATWQQIPVWAQNDAVGFTWDNSLLRYADGTYKVQVVKANNTSQVLSQSTVLAKAATGAISGYAKIDEEYLSKIITTFTLTPKEPISQGSNQIYFQYAHQIGLTGISISLPIGYGGSINWSGSYDEAATTYTSTIKKPAGSGGCQIFSNEVVCPSVVTPITE